MENKKYEVIIEEVVSSTFEIEAESYDEALEKSIEKYKNGTFVLEPGEIISKKVAVVDNDEELEWIDF